MDNRFYQTPTERQHVFPYNDGDPSFASGGLTNPRPRFPGPPPASGQDPPGMLPAPPPSSSPAPFWPPQAPQWAMPPLPTQQPGSAHSSQPYPFPPPRPPPSDCYRHPAMPQGYGFDPSMPPPPFPPPQPAAQFPPPLNAAPPQPEPSTQPRMQHGWIADGRQHMSTPGIQALDPRCPSGLAPGPSSYRYEYQPGADAGLGLGPQRVHRDPSDRPSRPLLAPPHFPAQGRADDRNGNQPRDTRPQDEEALQRSEDERWVRRFLQSRVGVPRTEPERKQAGLSFPRMREAILGVARLVPELSLVCQALKNNLENTVAWEEQYAVALTIRQELQEKLEMVTDSHRVEVMRRKLCRIAKRRVRLQRRKRELLEEQRLQREHKAEKEAAIDGWRRKRIQEVQEKKREKELRLEADSVLSEVMKKQADSKRMLEVLHSLEKLRKLRKEAASRKGIFPEAEADRVFEEQLERLRALIRKRMGVYTVEENALRVMLEGEREEGRRKDLEKQQRKEREKQLQRRREVEAMLFGEELPAHHPLEPYQDFYTQAQRSLPVLVQIRRDWDAFLVPDDHPDGTTIPEGWVLPAEPSDPTWASALDPAH